MLENIQENVNTIVKQHYNSLKQNTLIGNFCKYFIN